MCELPFTRVDAVPHAHTDTRSSQPHLITPTQNLFDPLKMYDTGFSVPTDKINRYSTSYSSTPLGRLQFVFRPR